MQTETPPETLIETLAILSILITRFPAYLANVEPQPVPVLTPILNHPRPAVRKRAITTLAQFMPHSQPQDFAALLSSTIVPGLAPSAKLDTQRTVVQLVAAIARHSPHQIAPSLSDIIPNILKDSQRDDEELRESCLQVSKVSTVAITSADLYFVRRWRHSYSDVRARPCRT